MPHNFWLFIQSYKVAWQVINGFYKHSTRYILCACVVKIPLNYNYNSPLFGPKVEPEGNLPSLDCIVANSAAFLRLPVSIWSVRQCLHPDFEGCGVEPTGVGLLGILASKLKTLWTKSGQSSPHLQVPSVFRYSITWSRDLRRLLFGLKRKSNIFKFFS